MLNLRRLHLLQQLHQLGTVRAVAQAASTSASSVSQQLAVLEAETHIQLLERVGRRVRLTPAGLILATRAAEVLGVMESIESEMTGLTTSATGPVRLSCFSSAITSLVIPAARQIAARWPLIDLRISELEPDASLQALDRGDCDIAVTAGFSSPPVRSGDGRTRYQLSSDEVLIVLPADHSPVLPGPLDIAELASERWSLDLTNTYLARLTLDSCRQSGFEARIAGRFASIEALLTHVEAGLSIALLPQLAIDQRYGVTTRHLRTPVRRHITATVRDGAARRLAVQKTLATLQHLSATLTVPS